MKCIWDNQKILGAPLSKENRSLLLAWDLKYSTIFPPKSRLINTAEHLQDVHRCTQLTKCRTCTSPTCGCVYFGKGTCLKNKCRKVTLDEQILISSLDQYPEEGSRTTRLPRMLSEPKLSLGT